MSPNYYSISFVLFFLFRTLEFNYLVVWEQDGEYNEGGWNLRGPIFAWLSTGLEALWRLAKAEDGGTDVRIWWLRQTAHGAGGWRWCRWLEIVVQDYKRLQLWLARLLVDWECWWLHKDRHDGFRCWWIECWRGLTISTDRYVEKSLAIRERGLRIAMVRGECQYLHAG